MNDDLFRRVLILTGPTGSGKSQLALELAERLDAEIVAMDSMTLYRGMDIGTAKPTSEARARVRHHLLDVLDPWESANVATWLRLAAEAVRQIEGRGKQVLFVGGTALYLKALLFGLFDGPPRDEALRAALEFQAQQQGTTVLHERLRRVDPASAARVHPNDLRRVVRALEVYELTGQPISAWQTQWQRQQLPLEALCLDLPRELLYQRIDNRVDQMLQQGLLDEVERLRRLTPALGREARQALGYKELLDFLDGHGGTLDEVVQRVKTRTRNFAKRQLTWFRHLPGCLLIRPELTFDHWRSRMR